MWTCGIAGRGTGTGCRASLSDAPHSRDRKCGNKGAASDSGRFHDTLHTSGFCLPALVPIPSSLKAPWCQSDRAKWDLPVTKFRQMMLQFRPVRCDAAWLVPDFCTDRRVRFSLSPKVMDKTTSKAWSREWWSSPCLKSLSCFRYRRFHCCGCIDVYIVSEKVVSYLLKTERGADWAG